MKISVIVTSYNQKSYLVEAIDSVLAQTLQPCEIIIADDASSDGSQEVIEDYRRRYPDLIRPLCHRENQGIPRNRNSALQAVQGDYVTSLDGDDRFLPAKLEREAATLSENPGARICFSNYYYINRHGDRNGQWATAEDTVPTGDVFTQVFARAFPRGSLYRSELIDVKLHRDVGLYDPQFEIYEDYELRIRLTKHGQVVHCPELLVEYRRHPGGISRVDFGFHLKVLQGILAKNKPLLEDLSLGQRWQVQRRLSQRFSKLAGMTAASRLDSDKRSKALRYWLRSLRYDPTKPDSKLLWRILLNRQEKAKPRKKKRPASAQKG